MSTAVHLPHAPAPGRSQATQIEQTRAASQVFAAVLAAHERPRVITYAVAEMTEACRQKVMAEKAFYRYSRGGSQISGPTVQLARELARCWGNIEHGVAELARNDDLGESELVAFAWDLQANTRVSNTFIVKHGRDTTKDGYTRLVDQRDIYENNTNLASRRVREAILNCLPVWFRQQAIDLCRKTIADGGGIPLQQRIAGVVAEFTKIGVTQQQLESKLGRMSGSWTEFDVAELGIVFRSIQAGETTRDEEFPPAAAVITAADLAPPEPAPEPEPAKRRAPRKTSAPGKIRAPAGGADTPAAADATPPGPPLPGDEPKVGEDIPSDDPTTAATREQIARMDELLSEADCTDGDERLRVAGLLLGRTLTTSAGLTAADATLIIDRLIEIKGDGSYPDALSDAVTDLINNAAIRDAEDELAAEHAAADDDARAES